MLRDLAIVLMAAGATLIACGGIVALIRSVRRRPWADVLDMIEPPRAVISRDVATDRIEIPIVMPLRCTCTARLSFCQCAVDGVRNPRGAGRGRYCCETCGTSDRTAFLRCHHPVCPDGRDQVRR